MTQVKLFYFLLFFTHSLYANELDECKLQDLEESVHELDHKIDRLKFKPDKYLKEPVVEINEKINEIIQQFYSLPENCQQSSLKISSFVRDIQILKQCTASSLNVQRSFLFEGYSSGDASYFTEMLTCAEGITHLVKKAEIYRSLARISFLSDFEVNKNFYNLLKDMVTSADSTVSNILIETMTLIAAKTIRITDSYEFHADLLVDLYEYNRTAGKEASTIVGIDLSEKFGPESLEIIQHIPDIALRSYAYLAMLSNKSLKTSKKKAVSIFIIPHLMDVMNAKEFGQLDEDLKNRINAMYEEEIPEAGKTLMISGEMCLLYNTDNKTRAENVYVKEINGSMTDWKFIKDTEGNIELMALSINVESEHVFLPRNAPVPEFWVGNITFGSWQEVPNGVDCSVREETHSQYVCHNVGDIMRSPEQAEKILSEDRTRIEENNSRRKLVCGD